MPPTQALEALKSLLRQTEISGAARRALLLHTDRLPKDLTKPHHLRLARAAVAGLAQADRAQMFDLPRGRVAIVWRARGGREVEQVLEQLAHLLDGLPAGQAPPPADLITVYDLPAQGPSLVDDLNARPPSLATGGSQKIDAPMLARLEQALVQAEMSHFVRWRPVAILPPTGTAHTLTLAPLATAWDERSIAAADVAATLCPDHALQANPWLFRRLTRSFDRRLLALHTGPHQLAGARPFALHLNIASILAADFLRFDAELPSALRGHIMLYVQPADVLADPAAFFFARNFAHARGYKILLRGVSLGLADVLDITACGVDFVQVALTPDVATNPALVREAVGPATKIVLSGVDRTETLAWAASHGFLLVRGHAVANAQHEDAELA